MTERSVRIDTRGKKGTRRAGHKIRPHPLTHMVVKFTVHYPARWEDTCSSVEQIALAVDACEKQNDETFLVTVDKPTVSTTFGIVMTSMPGMVTVLSLLNSSALRKQGLAIGDRILKINGIEPEVCCRRSNLDP